MGIAIAIAVTAGIAIALPKSKHFHNYYLTLSNSQVNMRLYIFSLFPGLCNCDNVIAIARPAKSGGLRNYEAGFAIASPTGLFTAKCKMLEMRYDSD